MAIALHREHALDAVECLRDDVTRCKGGGGRVDRRNLTVSLSLSVGLSGNGNESQGVPTSHLILYCLAAVYLLDHATNLRFLPTATKGVSCALFKVVQSFTMLVLPSTQFVRSLPQAERSPR